jgi:hypothetical protein
MVKLKKKPGAAKRVRRQHTGAFKARLALAALHEDKTMSSCVRNLICTPTKLPNGNDSYLSAQRTSWWCCPPKPVVTLLLFSGLHKLSFMRISRLAAGPRPSVAQTSWDCRSPTSSAIFCDFEN